MYLSLLYPTLAQHNPLVAAEPPPLVSASGSSGLISSLLFETPGAWFLAFTLLIAAIALLTRPQKKLKYGGLVLFLLTLVFALAQHFITTDREAITIASRAAATAVAKADSAELQRLLSSDFKVTYSEAPLGRNKEETIRRAVEVFRVHPPEISINDVRVIVDNDRFARSQLNLTARNDQTGGYPIASWWILNWEKVSTGWQLTSADLFSSSIPLQGQ